MEKNKKHIKRQIIYLLLSAVFVAYGFLIMSIRSGTHFYAVWYGLAGLCVCFFIMSKLNIWEKLPKGLIKAIKILACLLFALFIFIEGLILSGFSSKGDDDLDFIIVLGAQIKESGPSYILQRRLDRALIYLKENPDTICIVSGGQGYNEPFPEAEGMADYLIQNGVEESRIIEEPRSSSTEENIKNSMEFTGEDASVGIVTNNFHVFRAVQTAKRLGIENACGIAAPVRALFLPNNMLREFLAVMKFYVTAILKPAH